MNLKEHFGKFLIYLQKERGFSSWTINAYKDGLGFFLTWCELSKLNCATDITVNILTDYKEYLFNYNKSTGQPLCSATMNQRLSKVRLFFKWLSRKNYILFNPASELELIKQGRKLPRYVLTEKEAKAILKQPDINTPNGIRDRAILETFYSTGMRKAELISLKINSIDFNQGTVFIKKGKGGYDRIIPIGESARFWVGKYINEVRDLWKREDNSFLFLAVPFAGKRRGLPVYGGVISNSYLNALVRKYIKDSQTGKVGSCHLFRHAMATHMLNNGASVRYVQQMLGHQSIETTQVYTHVSITQLKEIHTATMPSIPFLIEKIETNNHGIYERKQGIRKPNLLFLARTFASKGGALAVTKNELNDHLTTYLKSLQVQKLSQATIDKRKYNLEKFILWCNEKEYLKLIEINREALEGYNQYLHDLKHFRTGNPLAVKTIEKHLTCLQGFFSWLFKKNLIIYNPAAELERPRHIKSLPGQILTPFEAEKIFTVPNIKTPTGLRDRAILELLYSTGIRRKELANLELKDIDLESKTLFIKEGKGEKDRYIPVGEKACFWVNQYINEARNKFSETSTYLFLSGNGSLISKEYLGIHISNYVKKAEIGKTGGCLLFRHSMATTMLENGADIRFIQQMLGHSDIKTTELYTHISINKLKEVHQQTHPLR